MKKIRVGILGVTGRVGQKLFDLLSSHPWFEIVALGSSGRSVGKLFRNMPIFPCEPNLFDCEIVFSSLEASVAEVIEKQFAQEGFVVISNSSSYRMDPKVPLLIPEVNSEQLELLKQQSFGKGALITNPNCSVIGIAMALKPLSDQFGIEAAHVVTMQAVSGAGFSKEKELDISDNVIPFIENEEEKIETEMGKILRKFPLSAQCMRVNVSNGHLACVSVKLKKKAEPGEILDSWTSFEAEPQKLQLPSAPKRPILYFAEENFPQPKLHRDVEMGMGVSVGRLRRCPILDWKFVLLSHNTIRGAAGGAILNAELFVSQSRVIA